MRMKTPTATPDLCTHQPTKLTLGSTQVSPIKPHLTLPPPACTSLPPRTHAVLRPHMCKHASPNHPSPRSLVITLAQSKMLEVFGLEMREVTKAPQRGANKGAAGKHLYNIGKH